MSEPARKLHLRRCRSCGTAGGAAMQVAAINWALLDVESPSGVCTKCAKDFGWHPAILATIGTTKGEEILAKFGFESDFSRRDGAP